MKIGNTFLLLLHTLASVIIGGGNLVDISNNTKASQNDASISRYEAIEVSSKRTLTTQLSKTKQLSKTRLLEV